MKFFLVHLSLLVGLLLINSRGMAQPGIVTTIAGGGTSTAEGAVALSASITPTYLDVDDAGNVYFKSGNYIKKYVAATNRIYTIAGNGTVGYTGDGGAATNAAIDIRDLCVDGAGNVYIADNSHAVVRKMTAATGIISTLPIPLTDDPWAVTCASDGNIYIANMLGVNDVVKYDPTTGIYSTVISSSSSTQNTGVGVDLMGNIFLSTAPGTMWKKNASTGILSSYGGGPGTVAGKMDVDYAGNVYCISGGSGIVKKTSATVAVNIANGPLNDAYSGIPISQISTNPNDICCDRYGNIYYATGTLIRKVYNPDPTYSSATGNCYAYSTKKCNGVSIVLLKNATFPSTNVVTDFGDGTSDTSPIPSAVPVTIEHVYSATATYNIKHKLYSGSSLVDSVMYSYDYSFCRTFASEIFYDENSDCSRGPAEHGMGVPSKIVIDSNSVTIDTITVTSGFSYDAFGMPGDVYSLRILPVGNVHALCPLTGIISSTLTVAPTTPLSSFAIQCGSAPGYDFTTFVSARAGRHALIAKIIVNNPYCASVPSTLSFTNSKYQYYSASEVPLSYSGYSTYWDFSGMNSISAINPPRMISLHLESPVFDYTPGDTTKSNCTISPISGDLTPSNNIVIRIDTVKASFDPNYIEVSPSGCIPKNATELTYTIGFENTGNDTAHNIYVLDTIPNSLDISSFEPLAASHEMHVYKYNLGGYYVIRFDFPNIMLPDSSHHNFCHGMFVYKIKTYGTTQSRVMVNNRVGIYFDENEVVMTNTATNEIGCPVTGIANPSNPPVAAIQNVTLFPNPTTGDLTIKTDGNSFNSCTITNAIGQQVWQQGVQKAEERVNLAHLPAGVYHVNLRGDGVSEVRKFVKY